jgi:hypothetical protein
MTLTKRNGDVCGLFALAMFALVALSAASTFVAPAAAASPAANCTADYRSCIDNDVLFRNHFVRSKSGYLVHADEACRGEAESEGRTLPQYAFTNYASGRSFVTTGVAKLTYNDLVCTVDLKSGLIKSVVVQTTATPAETADGCSRDYRLCSDNLDVVDFHGVRERCRDEAKPRGYPALNKDAISGWFDLQAFDVFSWTGRSFIDTGVASLAEHYAAVPLLCVFDLNANLVKSLSPIPAAVQNRWCELNLNYPPCAAHAQETVTSAPVADSTPLGCITDYRLCADNADVVRRHGIWNVYDLGDHIDTDGGIPLADACTEDALRRGLEPIDIPVNAYSGHPPGRSFIDTGIAKLAYRGAVCTVDLKTGLVKSVARP